MVEGISIIKHRKDYLDQVKEMLENMDLACKGCLCFDGEKLYFDTNEDDLLDEKEIYMVNTKSFLIVEEFNIYIITRCWCY